MVRIELVPVQTAYAPGEEVGIRIRITNDGPAPVQLAHPARMSSDQPIYNLVGPAFPAGKTFSMTSAARERDYPLDQARRVTIQVDPHSTWQEVIDLTSAVPFRTPGEYKISCRYDRPEGALQSPVAAFHVAQLVASETMVGQGTRPFGNGFGSGLFTLAAGADRALYSLEFNETRSDIGEADVSIRRVRTVPREALDFTVPDLNFPVHGEEAEWIVWREGRKLEALSTFLNAPAALDLGQEIARLVKPALKTKGGPLEVLALAKDETELLMASIDHSPLGEAKGFSVRWKVKLPAPPVFIMPALDSEQRQGRRHLVLVSRTQDGIEVHHTTYTQGAAPSPFQTTPIKGVRAAQAYLPALAVDQETGHAFCSILVAGPDKTPASVVDLEWDERSQLVRKPVVTALGSFPEHVKAGRVLVAKRGGAMSRRAVLVDVKNQLYRIGPTGEVAPAGTSGVPTDPLILLPGKQTDYVLLAEPAGGLEAEHIH